MRGYKAGSWNFKSGTMWSRLTYRLAKDRDQLIPSPVVDRFNMTREFEKQVSQAAGSLVKQKLCRWKNIKTANDPSTSLTGYKRHRARGRDLFLTSKGSVEAMRLLRARGQWAEEGLSRCDEAQNPRGPLPSGMSGCDG